MSEWEKQIQAVANSFAYPPTPDVAAAMRKQPLGWHRTGRQPSARLAWAIVLALLLLGGLLAVPRVRAAVMRIFRVGAITIFEADTIPGTAVASPSVTPAANQIVAPATATPLPVPFAGEELIFNLAGETTVEAVQEAVRFPLHTLSYPEDLGLPDRVFHQKEGAWPDTVIFVWLKPEAPEEVLLSFFQIGTGDYAYKGAEKVQESEVSGQPAFWIEGPHLLQLQAGGEQPWLFVEGNVLIWQSDAGVTYRLESELPLAEALRVAEAIRPLPE